MEYLNKQYLLDKRPTGMPQDDCWMLNDELITSLKKNEIIIEVKYLSIDPYMRGRMNDSKSYAAPAKIGEPMTGETCLLYTSPSPRDTSSSRMPSSA